MTRTWLVTGVGSGFGRQLAEQRLAVGDRVAGTVRRPDAVADLVESHGNAFWVGQLELTETARIREVVDAAQAHFGRLDVVVATPATGCSAPPTSR